MQTGIIVLIVMMIITLTRVIFLEIKISRLNEKITKLIDLNNKNSLN